MVPVQSTIGDLRNTGRGLSQAYFSYAVTTGSQMKQSFISQTRSMNSNGTKSKSVLHKETTIMPSLVYRTSSVVTVSQESTAEHTSIHLLLETPPPNSNENLPHGTKVTAQTHVPVLKEIIPA